MRKVGGGSIGGRTLSHFPTPTPRDDYFLQRKGINNMDYQGQKLSENLFYYIILLFGIVGWIYGYILQDFTYVFYSWSVGVGISLVLCVPDWPIYNRHPIKWLESIPDRSEEEETKEETKQETKKSK